MKLILQLLQIILYSLLPASMHEELVCKIKRTIKTFTNNLELRIFWRILFFPIVLSISFVIGLIKTVLIWIIPGDGYSKLIFIWKQFLNDKVVRKYKFKLAWKRACLSYEMFSKGAEKKESYGEKNPNITFYVIRPYYYIETNELLSYPQHLLMYYYIVLQKISYAINRGWIPMVDFEHYDGLLAFAEQCPVNGTKNAWEYYWKQPSPYTLEEVYESKNVILSSRNAEDFGFIPATKMLSPHDIYASELAKRCGKYVKYTEFSEKAKININVWYEKLFPKEGKVLGVIYRSTSYGTEATINHSHPVQPQLATLIKRAKKIMTENKMDYLYFVNEEEKNIEFMREAFGERLIVLPRKRYTFYGFSKDNPNPLYKMGERYNTNLSYLTEVALLSRCDGLLGAMSSGTRAAIIWNQGQYDFMEIIDLGLW